MIMVPVKSFMVTADKFIKVDRDVKVREAAEIMRDNGIGSVFVTREGVIIGVLTDTDLVRRLVAVGLDPVATTVEQIMSAPILTIDENKTLLDANDLMAREHIRHLGISQGEQLVGMISVRDLVVFLTNLPRK
jgi:CBS domain-containing protein